MFFADARRIVDNGATASNESNFRFSATTFSPRRIARANRAGLFFAPMESSALWVAADMVPPFRMNKWMRSEQS